MTTETNSTETPWHVVKHTDLGRAGTGNWDAFHEDLQRVREAAEDWKRAIAGVEKPWLCWNIDDEWSCVQQRLVLSVGWTPVVGWDPNCSPEKRSLVPGAIGIDFNARFGLPALWPHFPLEFAFMWAPRLAFWHADLLVRPAKMQALAGQFSELKDGEMAAVPSWGGMRNIFRPRMHRYWELIGCTTAGASQHQFDTGCGWWRHFYLHPNTPEAERADRRRHYYDSGVGIMYWKRHYRRRVLDIPEREVAEGHCTAIGARNYKVAKSKAEELRLNFDLPETARKLGLAQLL